MVYKLKVIRGTYDCLSEKAYLVLEGELPYERLLKIVKRMEIEL